MKYFIILSIYPLLIFIFSILAGLLFNGNLVEKAIIFTATSLFLSFSFTILLIPIIIKTIKILIKGDQT